MQIEYYMQPIDTIGATIGATIPAISSSRLKCWLGDREEYFLRYGCGVRTNQTWPMAVGTVFDRYVKEELAALVPGMKLEKGYCGELSKNWTSDPVVYNELLQRGKKLVREYISMGGVQDGLLIGQGMSRVPGIMKLDADMVGDVNGVAICGKPDWIIYSTSDAGAVGDWKVSTNGTSPCQGWNKYSLKPLQVHDKSSKEAQKILCDEGGCLWDWYVQGWFYRRLTGLEVFFIHQILGGSVPTRYAQWKIHTYEDLDQKVEDYVIGLAEAMANGRVWTDLSPGEDAAKQASLKEAFASGERREEWMKALGIG